MTQRHSHYESETQPLWSKVESCCVACDLVPGNWWEGCVATIQNSVTHQWWKIQMGHESALSRYHHLPSHFLVR